jgi:hypothetical protein
LLFFLLSLSIFYNNLFSQVSNTISSVNISEAKEDEPINVRVELLQTRPISNVRFAYLPYGGTEYLIYDMNIIGPLATFTIPGENVNLPYISYYIIVDLLDGSREVYPLGAPDASNPLQITVEALSEKDKEIILLSPSMGEIIALEDVFISVSFVKASDNIHVPSTKIFLNDNDITGNVLFAGDLVLFYSENFPGSVGTGNQNLRIETYDSTGALYHTVESDFQTVKSGYFKALTSQFKYRGSLEAESRNEQFNDDSQWYNNVKANISGNYDEWNFSAYTYLTSEEESSRQPQHRFSVSIANEWFILKGGDTYPRFPKYMLDGKRVRGFYGDLRLGFFNLQTSFGEITRNVEGELLETYTKDEAPLSSDVIEINEAMYDNPYGKVNLGTYGRDIFAIRPSFGSGENFQLGFSYLHSKDDMNSIEFGGSPQENAVAGTDLKFSLDDQNIVFNGQAMVSLFNEDISSGDFTDAQIDSVFGPGSIYDADTEDIKRLRDLVSNFITVNQYVGPLNPQELSSLAAEAGVELSYVYNNLNIKYIYRGNDYQSFGQDYLRTDVKGINIVDRIRMFENKAFLSLGYESLDDNLQETKMSTTTYQTINTTLSIFPRTDFPNITLGYTNYNNENEISPSDTANSQYLVDDQTNKFLARLSYDVKAAGVDHAASLSIVNSNKEDNSTANNDAQYTSLSLSVNSYWEKHFTTFLSLINYASEIAGLEYNYFTFSLGGRYKMLEDKLLLTASLSPSFGDFERQSFDLVAQYDAIQNLSFIFQFRYYNIPDQSSNSVAGLTTRFNF